MLLNHEAEVQNSEAEVQNNKNALQVSHLVTRRAFLLVEKINSSYSKTSKGSFLAKYHAFY